MPISTPAQLHFSPSVGFSIRAHFAGGGLSSELGRLLLRGVDQQIGLTARLAAALDDRRHPSYSNMPSAKSSRNACSRSPRATRMVMTVRHCAMILCFAWARDASPSMRMKCWLPAPRSCASNTPQPSAFSLNVPLGSSFHFSSGKHRKGRERDTHYSVISITLLS